MKILDINNFISERVKIKPITNAEFDTARKNMQLQKFNMSNLVCGTIVMFRNSYLGLYIEGYFANEIGDFYNFNVSNDPCYFLTMSGKKYPYPDIAYLHMFTRDLKETYGLNEGDVIRIYDNPLTIDEITSMMKNDEDYYSFIEKMAKDRTYIERQ